MKLNRTKITKTVFLILSFVVFVWFCMSLIRTIFNLSKIYTERNLIFASDDEKKNEIFGELHPFLTYVENSTSRKSDVNLIITNKNIDNRFYYLSYYYLYPRNINFISYNQIDKLENGYVVTFGLTNDSKTINDNQNYLLLSSFAGRKYKGSIYKLK